MTPLTHFAILGRQHELGLIELESILGSGMVVPFGGHALLGDNTLSIATLGGTIKLGRIVDRIKKTDPMELITTLELERLPRNDGKLTYGLSWYGPGANARLTTAMGLELKKRLRGDGTSVRYLSPKAGETALNAAQYKFNGLNQSGFELVILATRDEYVIGIVESVQDVDAYAARDYDRPARSAKVGMLPPKLAQILVNTTHGAQIHDPFCGTGVILQEALLNGRTVTGSDLEPEMVAATIQNMKWLNEVTNRELPPLLDGAITMADATKLKLPPGTRSIVSEGYLGPNMSSAPNYDELSRIQRELIVLYRETLRNLATQLPSGAEVSLCAPAWHITKRWEPLNIVDEATQLGYTTKVFETVPKSATAPIIYGRDNQHVGRALILLTKV